ncbi:hypothetical protein QX233_20275 [Chryseobacterium gambrini]|uniref:Uncharacterized protein n=1 Tax=Chryseobacterium gambrini TaxID=373672 RepID=A0AAJ1R9Q1_9FLAO|nr:MULTISPECIES: hypothetical protein [Chryseobacterium]MDN4014814.1 hypothetical protein [Chryseobacterium gambrini]MDN4027900.1 hypothetical protein [Chryseobacterium gambrini]QWA39697.1 hypothetical protein KKI44_05675 [Chryseobacterium sp. ZHDP1]
MKTILTYDLRIQQSLILLFLATILAAIITKQEFLGVVIIVEFFLIAVAQYSLNIIKAFSNKYIKTDSRKVYVFISTYVVIGFLILILSSLFKFEDTEQNLKNIFELMVMSWIFLSPILIIQSLMISFFDAKNSLNEQP